MYTTLLKSWVGVASFTIPLSGQLVLYTTRSKTLLNVDFIANKACLANLLSFTHKRKVEVDWARMWTKRGQAAHFRLSCLNCLLNYCFLVTCLWGLPMPFLPLDFCKHFAILNIPASYPLIHTLLCTFFLLLPACRKVE